MNDTEPSNDWKDEDAAPAPAAHSRLGVATRRLLFGTNALIAMLLATALLVMVNYLAARHHLRVDVSRSRPYELSEKTRQILAGISNRVDAVLFLRPSHSLFDDAEALLREYESACPKLHIEHVDPDREQARAAQLVKKYGLERPNCIIFSCIGNDALVLDEDMVELDMTGAQAGIPPRRTGFLGEQAFSTALIHVTQPRQPVVYFLLGHGERDPNEHDKYSGFSTVGRMLAMDRIQVRTLSLVQSNTIPADADALIIAGPQNKFAPAEIETIQRHLSRSGRLLLTLETAGACGLEPLLQDWGVRLGSGAVVDTSRSLDATELFITSYGNHPISAPLTNSTVVLGRPRPLEAIASSGVDKPRVAPLLISSVTSWAENDVDGKNVKFDAARDRKGPLPVALAVEKGGATGVDMDLRPTRIVVIGDTTFASNGSLVGADPDLFMNSVNWLVQRPDLLSIAAKPFTRVRLVMDQHQLTLLFGAVVLVLPAGVALLGLLVWLRRRS